MTALDSVKKKKKVLSGIDEEKSVLVFYKKEPWIGFQTYM